MSVHANIYTGDKKVYEPDGDEKLRGNYHQRMREMLKVGRASEPCGRGRRAEM